MPRRYLDEIRPQYAGGGAIGRTINAMRDAFTKIRNSPEVRNWIVADYMQKQMANTPLTYNGGTTDETRRRFWSEEPIMRQAVSSIAGRYGINPYVLLNRLDEEGFTDHQIKDRNALVRKGQPQGIARGYDILYDAQGRGTAFKSFGLDDSATYIDNGQVKLIDEKWSAEDNTNEKGRKVRTANGETIADNIGIVAAMLSSFRNQAKEDFPNASDADLDRLAVMYYNRGRGGGRSYYRRGGNDKKYSIRTSFATGGSIHINPANRGKFKATMARTGKTAEELSHSSNPLTRKRAIFAINARKWNH